MKGSTWRRTTTIGFGVAGALAVMAAPAGAASTVSYNPSPFGTSMNIIGEANDDQVTVTVAGGSIIVVSDAGTGGVTTADPDCANVGGTVQCPLDPPDPAPPADPNAPVTGLSAQLAAASDTFDGGGAPFTQSIDGGTGDDLITGGPEIDSLNGGNDNDSIFGGDGDDNLNGGGTNFTTGGNDLLDGQGGVDSANFGRTLAVNVSLNALPDDGFPGEADNAMVEQVSGGNGDDVLTGDAAGNLLDGNGGDDLLTGLEGNDLLDGDDGNDGLIGGPQRDQLECDDGSDTAILDPRDVFDGECERTGAEVDGGTSTVNKKGKTKVPVSCPVEEANPCGGTLVVRSGQKQLGSAAFNLAAGATANVSLTLNKDGRKLLDKGSLLATAEAQTTEPIGTSVNADDVLLRPKAK